MAQSKFTLYKYIKLANGSWRYGKAAFYSNGMAYRYQSAPVPKLRSSAQNIHVLRLSNYRQLA